MFTSATPGCILLVVGLARVPVVLTDLPVTRLDVYVRILRDGGGSVNHRARCVHASFSKIKRVVIDHWCL